MFVSGNSKETASATPGEMWIIGEPEPLFNKTAAEPLNSGFVNYLPKRDLILTFIVCGTC